MKWAGRVELLGEGRGAYRIFVGRLKGRRDNLKDLGVDGG